MIKKTLYSILFIVLAIGTVYAWQKVGFTRKTAMFFQVVLGDETAMVKGRGGPPMGGNRGGEMSGLKAPGGQTAQSGTQDSFSGRPSMAEGAANNAPATMQPGQPPSGAGGSGRPGGHGGPGGTVSLSNVGLFTVIMAFVVMLTVFLDSWFRNFARLRRSRSVRPVFPLTA